jgi:hypothetical protein
MRRTLILFTLGAATMFPFDYTITLALGVAFFVAAVISGVFAIATPEALGAEPLDEEKPS